MAAGVIVQTECPPLVVPLCFGGRGGVRVLLEESLSTVRSEVEKASGQDVRVRAGGRGGGILPSLPLVLLAIFLQGQQGERNHATGQRGELRLSAVAVVLPGFVSRDGVWREEGGNMKRGGSQSELTGSQEQREKRLI